MHLISDIQDYVLHLLKSPLTIPVILSKKPKQPKHFQLSKPDSTVQITELLNSSLLKKKKKTSVTSNSFFYTEKPMRIIKLFLFLP